MSVLGTPAPVAAPPRAVAVEPLARIVRAAEVATRAPEGGVRRRGRTRAVFVQLALRQGWEDRGRLARACGVTVQAIRKAALRPVGGALPAAELCLGDDRLLRFVPPDRSRFRPA